MGAYQGLRKLTVIIGVVELRKVVSFLASVDYALKNFKRNLMTAGLQMQPISSSGQRLLN